MPELTFDPNSPAVTGDQLSADRQAKPQTLSTGLDGALPLVEPLKDLLALLRAYSASGIGYRDTDAARLFIGQISPDRDRSVVGCESDPVLDKISEDLSDTLRIGIHGWEVSGYVSGEDDPLGAGKRAERADGFINSVNH